MGAVLTGYLIEGVITFCGDGGRDLRGKSARTIRIKWFPRHLNAASQSPFLASLNFSLHGEDFNKPNPRGFSHENF